VAVAIEAFFRHNSQWRQRLYCSSKEPSLPWTVQAYCNAPSFPQREGGRQHCQTWLCALCKQLGKFPHKGVAATCLWSIERGNGTWQILITCTRGGMRMQCLVILDMSLSVFSLSLSLATVYCLCCPTSLGSDSIYHFILSESYCYSSFLCTILLQWLKYLADVTWK
jgi:hypothetical protein